MCLKLVDRFRPFTNALLKKRREFEHENEVRLIFLDVDREHVGKMAIEFPIDPNVLFDEVVFDPRLSEDEFRVRSTILMKLGCTVPISQSELYKVGAMTIRE